MRIKSQSNSIHYAQFVIFVHNLRALHIVYSRLHAYKSRITHGVWPPIQRNRLLLIRSGIWVNIRTSFNTLTWWNRKSMELLLCWYTYIFIHCGTQQIILMLNFLKRIYLWPAWKLKINYNMEKIYVTSP